MHFSPASCLMKDINLSLWLSKVLIISFVFWLFARFCQLFLGVSTNLKQPKIYSNLEFLRIPGNNISIQT